MRIGAYNKLPHYHVIGRPVEFYIWIEKSPHSGDCSSKWIIGGEAFKAYNQLKQLFRKDRKAWMAMCESLYITHKKG